MLASVLMLAENGPSPFTLGGVSPEKMVSLPLLAGKLLSIAFSGLRLEAPRKSTGADSLWLDSGWHPRCLMTTGYEAYIVPSSLGWAKIDENSIYGKFRWTHKVIFSIFPSGPYSQEKTER